MTHNEKLKYNSYFKKIINEIYLLSVSSWCLFHDLVCCFISLLFDLIQLNLVSFSYYWAAQTTVSNSLKASSCPCPRKIFFTCVDTCVLLLMLAITCRLFVFSFSDLRFEPFSRRVLCWEISPILSSLLHSFLVFQFTFDRQSWETRKIFLVPPFQLYFDSVIN